MKANASKLVPEGLPGSDRCTMYRVGSELVSSKSSRMTRQEGRYAGMQEVQTMRNLFM